MIEKCQFGKMAIADRTYKSDLWIYPDQHVQDSWRRPKGHSLTHADIFALIETQPEVLVVGTGIFGRMRLDADIEPRLLDRKIELRSARTKSAAAIYNHLLGQGRRVAACFHLTC